MSIDKPVDFFPYNFKYLAYMKDFARFMMTTVAILAGLSLAWFGLYKVSKNPHPPSTSTPLVASLLAQAPFQVNSPDNGSAPFLRIVAEFYENDWHVGQQRLAEVLELHKESVVFLEPLSRQSPHLAKLKVIAEKDEAWKKIVFLSRSDAILKGLRELAPRWSFGTGEVFLTRFLSLSAIGLAGLLKVPGDVLYVTNHRELGNDEAEGLILAGLQQNKLVLFDSKNGQYGIKKQTAKILFPQKSP